MAESPSGGGTRVPAFKHMLDEDTRVLRDRVFEYLLDLEVKRATRYQYFLALLCLEFDGWQGEGATAAGGAASHEPLKVLADLLRDELRSTDIIGRVADGRFSIVLHHADEINTHRIGERLRRRIEEYAFAEGAKSRQTVSIGGACFPSSGNYPDDLRAEALKMLERARVEGGNKVYTAT